MKRNFKTSMMVAALTVATLGAFATKIAHTSGADEEEYTWTRTDGEALPNEQNPFVGTKTDAQENFGCSGSTDECAVGVPANITLPLEVIYQH